MKIEKKIIKELVGYLDEFNLVEIEYQMVEKKLKYRKQQIKVQLLPLLFHQTKQFYQI